MGERVMVFAPAPVLTVTVERQGDVEELHLHPGGQGIWQARMISSLGATVVLCVTVGGEPGVVLEKLLAEEDLVLRAVQRRSGTGWYVHDRRGGSRAEVAQHPGAPLVRHDIDELYTLALAEGLRAPISVLSGPAHPSVVPADVYRRLAADLGAGGGRVVADLSGEHLTAVLRGGAAFVKVSHEQLVADGRAPDGSPQALVGAAHRLRAEGAGAVLVSRADQPSLALFEDRVVEVRVPTLQVADARGAGDSMTAGVAAVLARGGSLTEALCTGAAAGALNVTRHGLGTGRAEAVAELVARVRLEPWPNGKPAS
jgi:1-phosphofructokinase